MAKHEESWYQTSLEVPQIRRALSKALATADVSPLREGPLDEPSAFAVLAQSVGGALLNRGFGPGMAAAQIVVHAQPDGSNLVQFIALASGWKDQMAASFANDNVFDRAADLKQLPKLANGRRMVEACVAELEGADAQLKRVD